MSVDNGFDGLTGHYLGQDWDLFGASGDEVLQNFARSHPEDVPDSIEGFDRLLRSTMSEDELLEHWSMTLNGGYDPRDDGYTFREWFAHARDVLIRAAGDGHPPSASGEV